MDGARPVDQHGASWRRCWLLDHDLLLIVVAPRSEAALGRGDRVVSEVTSQDQRGPSRPEVIRMKRADCLRGHIADRLGLTAVHPSGSLGLLEYRGPESDAGGLRGIGLGLLDLGQPELYMTVDITVGERRLGYRLGEQRESAIKM